MHRLPEFIKYIISYVNQIRYWRLACESKSSSHPCGARSYLYIIYIMSYVPRAYIGCRNLNRKAFLFNLCLRIIKCRFMKLRTKHRSDLPCDSEDALAVGPVGCYRYVKDPVVKPYYGLYILLSRHHREVPEDRCIPRLHTCPR